VEDLPIIPITTLLQTVCLILVYHFLVGTSSNVVNKLIICNAITLFLSSLIYLIMTLTFVYTEPISHERFVKGFLCTKDALLVHQKDCPLLNDKMIGGSEFEHQSFWTVPSIILTETAIVVIWLLAFASLALLLGSFVVYHAPPPAAARVKDRTKRAKLSSDRSSG
jgi:hypothetical protein